jgi:catechol 2,3-dioxygenase-like lactoylglutathione lyase family enzyme
VKKTVNFDNHYVYHFYYGNEHGTPSTIMTTFPYHGWGVPVGTKGAGQIRTTSFSIPRTALGFWRERLAGAGKTIRDGETPFGDPVLTVTDPSGLILELVGTDGDTRTLGDRRRGRGAGDPGTAQRYPGDPQSRTDDRFRQGAAGISRPQRRAGAHAPRGRDGRSRGSD